MPVKQCPDSHDLSAYAEGRLHGKERRRVYDHLRFCRDCNLVIGSSEKSLMGRNRSRLRGQR